MIREGMLFYVGWAGKSFLRWYWSKDMSDDSCAKTQERSPLGREKSRYKSPRGEMSVICSSNKKSNHG